ncbi:MAG: hypothetical protein ACT4NY_02930 [Pseudonocardiales bacterium]
MELGQLRFIVDENTLAVGKVMQQLRDDVAYVGDPLISDLIPRRSLDKHWIPVAAEHGWVAITNDHHMRTRHYEASLALEHGLMVVNVKGVGHRTAWDQLVRLTKHWQSVERFITKNPAGPWWLSLTDSGWRRLDYGPDKHSL